MQDVVHAIVRSRWARGAIVVAFLVSAGLAVTWQAGGWPPYRVDFDVYRLGGEVVRSGGALYDEYFVLHDHSRLPFTYPPLAAVLFAVFAAMPMWVGSLLITIASITGLLVITRLVLGRVVDADRVTLWWGALAATTGALWVQPVWATLDYGQVNIILLALVVVDGIAGRGHRGQGVLTGLAVAVKLTPAVFLLYYLLRGQWRAAGMVVASALAFTGLGWVLAPGDSLRYWTAVLYDPARIGLPMFARNQSVRGELLRLHLDSQVLWLVVAGVVTLLIAWVGWRLLAVGADTAALIVIAFVALYASPVSWDHHWVAVVPLLVLMIVWAGRGVGWRLWCSLVVAGLTILVLVPQVRVPNRAKIELTWVWWQHIVGNAYLWWGLVAMVAIGVMAPRLPADVVPTEPLPDGTDTGSLPEADDDAVGAPA
ncbi:MAG: glycosyltransferase 87 family protein [Gordonia sp. (in: high G+C Gram-positive bacteria)]